MKPPARGRHHGQGPGVARSDRFAPDQQLRVVHVITGLALGGAERHVQSLLQISRHDAQVLALYRDGPVGRELRARGYRARSLDLQERSRLAAILRTAVELRRLRPDVVHVHLLSGQAVGIPAARLASVPVVVSSEHSIMDSEVEGRPTTRQLKLLYRCWERLATHTVAVSPTTARRLREWGVPDHRISVVELGIDFARLRFDHRTRAEVRAELGIDERAQVVGAVGRLDPVKRFVELVSALGGWLAAADRHLVIAGAGPQNTLLTDLAARAAIGERVHLVGPRPDVVRLLSAFDVLVSPSRDETFGIAVVEAIGNGLPVVYAQCPAIDDLEVCSPRLIRLPRDPDRSRDAKGEAEQTAIRAGVERAIATNGPCPDRTRVPIDLLTHYDVHRRVAQLDDLYLRLLGRRHLGQRLLGRRQLDRQAGEPTSC